jgi:hypothetical protein
MFRIYSASKKRTLYGGVKKACITTDSISSTAVPGTCSAICLALLSFEGFTKSGEPKHLHPSGSTIYRSSFMTACVSTITEPRTRHDEFA